MLNYPSTPSGAALGDLGRVRAGIEAQGVPAKRLDDNLLIATWNLRAFDELIEKWEANAEDSPKRDLRSLAVIAEVIYRDSMSSQCRR